MREGEQLRVLLENALPEETTIHWHGLPVPNEMDGVPGITQDPVPSGGAFVDEFPADPSGSYFYHTHVGLQLDRGLYGPLVVGESSPHVSYDREYTLLLDDFTPEEPRITRGRGMGLMGMMGGMPRGPEYEAFLVNGHAPGDPPVEPVEVDSLEIGMGERYDVIVQAERPGAWNLIAAPRVPWFATESPEMPAPRRGRSRPRSTAALGSSGSLICVPSNWTGPLRAPQTAPST